jgi:hypothetical protein
MHYVLHSCTTKKKVKIFFVFFCFFLFFFPFKKLLTHDFGPGVRTQIFGF